MIAELASVSFPALGTTALLCVAEAEALPVAHDELERELSELDEACSRFRDDSELVRLNASAGGEPVAVGERLFEAVEVALRAAAASDGLVDPTVGRTLRLAGYDRRFASVRLRDGSSFRAEFAPVPGWRRVELDPARHTVRLPAGSSSTSGRAPRLSPPTAAHAPRRKLRERACSSASAATSRSPGRSPTAAGPSVLRTTMRLGSRCLGQR